MPTTLKVKVRDRWYTVEVGDLSSRPLRVLVDGDPVEVEFDLAAEDAAAPPPQEAAAAAASAPPPPVSPAPASTGPSAIKAFVSPMPGIVVSVAVKVGDQVVTGDEVCVMEAMKMQQVLRADWTGVVKAVHVQPGQQVLDGAPLIDLE